MKEQLKLYQLEKKIQGEIITPETLLTEGKVLRIVQEKEETYYMHYSLKENAFEGMQGLGKGNFVNLKDVFLIDDNFNVKYIASNGKEYGDEIKEKILEDETQIRFSSKAFSEYVSRISGVKEEDLKFKWMKDQTELTISDSNVDSLLDLVFFPNLTSLSLGDYVNAPRIITMDGIENCVKLKRLKVIYGRTKDYTAISSLNNLESFSAQVNADNKVYNNLMDALKFCNNLQEITLLNFTINNDMNRISELGNNLKTVTLQNCQITKIGGMENKTNLTSLKLVSNKIQKIEGLENLKQLKALYLSNNLITDITPLSANTGLTLLDLKGNTGIDGNRDKYTGKSLEALNKIGEILDRDGNIYLDVDKLGLFTNYKSLDLSHQNLTNLKPLKGFTQLTSLYLGYNQITLEDEESQNILKSMIYLETLDLSLNKVTNATAINSLKELTLLNVGGTFDLRQIQDIISNVRLVIGNETFKTIVNCDVDKITSLRLNSVGIKEIPDLSKFTKLEYLNLRGNNDITDFSTISEIVSLKNLNLSTNTNLHGNMFDFSKLTNLTILNLEGCKLWSEDLENLKGLKNNTNLTIDLSGNAVVDATALLELNENTKINLGGNVNLTEESKEKLKDKFKKNVSF